MEVTQKDVIGIYFNNSRLKRKISEELLIEKEQSSLNAQDQSKTKTAQSVFLIKYFYNK